MRKWAAGLGAFVLFCGVIITGLGVTERPALAATLTDCRFGVDQVFDVQWNMSGTLADNTRSLNISGITRPYYSNVLPAYSASGQYPTDYLKIGDFFRFENSSGNVSFVLYDSEQEVKHVTHLSGSFQALGPDFIFFLGNGFYGTVITTSNAYAYGSSASLPVTAENPTVDQALGFSNCSANPVSYSISGPTDDDDSGEGEPEENEESGSGGGDSGSGSAGDVAPVTQVPAIGLDVNASPGDASDGVEVFGAGEGLKPGTPLHLSLEPGMSLGESSVGEDGTASIASRIPAGLSAGTYRVVLRGTGANGTLLTLVNTITINPDGSVASLSGNVGTVTPQSTAPTITEKRLAYTGVASDGLVPIGLTISLFGLALLVYSMRARLLFPNEAPVSEGIPSPWEILQRPISVPGFTDSARLVVDSGGDRGLSLADSLRELDKVYSKIISSRIATIETRISQRVDRLHQIC